MDGFVQDPELPQPAAHMRKKARSAPLFDQEAPQAFQRGYKYASGSQPKSCIQCGSMQTPQWREGPLGPKTLCNACGVKWQRLEKARKNADKAQRVALLPDEFDVKMALPKVHKKVFARSGMKRQRTTSWRASPMRGNQAPDYDEADWVPEAETPPSSRSGCFKLDFDAEEGHGRCESDCGPRGRSSDGSQLGASDSEVDAAEQMVCMAAGVHFRKPQANLRGSSGAPMGASAGGQQWEAVHHGLSRPNASQGHQVAGATRANGQLQARKQPPQGQLNHQDSWAIDEPRQWAVDAARAVTAAEAEVNAVADVLRRKQAALEEAEQRFQDAMLELKTIEAQTQSQQ
ncbi:hypothetical protein WJX74_004332 [Apatococcus lobatus]|uniref:GATA-type domain-containing protein n=1 Tax=Apatococcus lobatus TaxID=904363 RepID=A0AAW1QVJ9_9CHLO